MIGEIRDQETAEIAVHAALTGHFLYSTLHTNDALSSITRLGELEVASFLLAEALEVVVAQRLIRKLCPACKVEVEADMDLFLQARAPQAAVQQLEEEGGKKIIYKAAAPETNCNSCRGKGYRGRTGIHEVVALNDDLRKAILEKKPLAYLEEIARRDGMQSLYYDAFLSVWNGQTSLEEASIVAAT
jgi:type IV pilus assembly protein PilB